MVPVQPLAVSGYGSMMINDELLQAKPLVKTCINPLVWYSIKLKFEGTFMLRNVEVARAIEPEKT